MRTLPLVLLALVPSLALGKGWNGVDPGRTTKAEVVQKFGVPSKAVNSGDKEILAYFQKEAIKGTVQVQFRVDTKTGTVERIDVFPGPVIERDAIENTYGRACPSGERSTGACYVKKLTDDFRTYFFYRSQGVAVFFNEDGKTVNSFTFQAPVTPGGEKTSASAGTGGGGGDDQASAER